MNTVLVTGANRGLGLEFCRQYAVAGWRVLACCRHPEDAAALRGLAADHAAVSLHRLDVAQAGQVDALARDLAGQPIDVLLCNAGVYGVSAATGFGLVTVTSPLNFSTVEAATMLRASKSFSDL